MGHARSTARFVYSFTACFGRASAQAVGRRHLYKDARIQSEISPGGICGGQSDTEYVPPPTSKYFCFSLSFHECTINIHSDTNDAMEIF
jgi:hypothetical protein